MVTVADSLRWAVILLGCFTIGVLIGNYVRYWRYAVPIWTTRGLLFAAAATLAVELVLVYGRLGESLGWRAPVEVCIMLVYLACAVSLYRWTRRIEGREYRHRAISDYQAERLRREAYHRGREAGKREARRETDAGGG